MSAPDRFARPVVVVTGALAPYTHILYERLAGALDRPLHVLVCSARESARRWALEEARSYRFEVLPGLRWHRSTVTNHYANPSVITRLLALDPAALVLNDFSPTMLMAGAVARARGIPYGLRTDGVAETDPGSQSRVRRMIRTVLARGATFGIGPSQGSLALLRSFGLDGPGAVSPLFPAWQPRGASPAPEARPFDLLFCGTLNEEVKGARFFTDTVLACAAQGRRLAVRVVGEGPLRAEMESRMAAAGLAPRFDGFLQQDALAEAYGSARLFHFPTRGDVWGIVVQEALQSGTLVMSSPHAGVTREVVEPGRCGVVLPLEVDAWAAATLALLDDPLRAATMRAAGARALAALTPERATEAYLALLEPLLAPEARRAAIA